jgi:predicted transcriptional regulator of viral defense system
MAQAARRVPRGVICLLSALRFHRLTTQNPIEIWMAIGVKAWRPRLAHPPLRLIYLSAASLGDGVEEHEVDGVKVKVFSAARTVVDCFRFRSKVGIDVAVEALREYRRVFPKGLDALWRFAERGRMTRVMTPYLESIG